MCLQVSKDAIHSIVFVVENKRKHYEQELLFNFRDYSNGKLSSKDYIKSPLNYVGGKYKLLPQIMPLFPDNISTFVDLFSGGANVGINVDAKTIVFSVSH